MQIGATFNRDNELEQIIHRKENMPHFTEIQIDAVGFKGLDCEKATALLEEALGVVGQKTKKPEYHQRTSSTDEQRVGR